MEIPGLVARKVDIDGRSFQGNKFDLNAYSGPAVITLSRAGASIQGSVKSWRGFVRLSLFPTTNT